MVLLTAIIIGSSATGGFVTLITKLPFMWFERWRQDLVSRSLAATKEKPAAEPNSLREIFNKQIMRPLPPHPYHTHGTAAAARATAVRFMEEVARNSGKESFHYQMSPANQRANQNGSRHFFWGKDTLAEYRPFQTDEHTIINMTDVDSYLTNLETFLCAEHKPVLLFTFTVTKAADDLGEVSFTFNEKGELVSRVSGGATYTHLLWNFETDQFKCVRTTCGIPTQVAFFLVDRRRVDDHHSLVLLTPSGRWNGIPAILANGLQGTRPRRFRPIQHTPSGPFIRFHAQTPQGLFTTTGVPGQHVSSYLPARYDDALVNLAKSLSVKIGQPSVMQFFEENGLREMKASASVMTAWLRATVKEKYGEMETVFPVAKGVISFDHNPAKYNPEDKPSLVPFMGPLVNGAHAPLQSKSNEEHAVKTRVNDYKRPPSAQKYEYFMMDCMQEFIERAIPKGSLVPLTLEQVREHQTRASQRQILDRGEVEPPRDFVTAFVKKEASQKAGDPRLIGTFDGNTKMHIACFMYAMYGTAKSLPFYGFGKPPTEVAKGIANVCQKSDHVVNTDYTRFDATVSPVARLFEWKMLIHAFGPEYLTTLEKLHKTQYNQKVRCARGTKYDADFARISGEMGTAIWNLFLNAFVAYMAWRMTVVSQHGPHRTYVQADEAWENLTEKAQFAGDDGVTGDIEVAMLEAAADKMGFILKALRVNKGQAGVEFLGRKYMSTVWWGDPNSMCDLARQLSKFHTTVTLHGVTEVEKLLEKCRAYVLTDGQTPVIGPFCRAVLAAHGAEVEMTEATRAIRRWGSDIPLEVQYPNEFCDEFNHIAETSLAPYCFDFAAFQKWLDEPKQLVDYLKPPTLSETKAQTYTGRVVVGPTGAEEVLGPEVAPMEHDLDESKSDEEENSELGPRSGKVPAKATAEKSDQYFADLDFLATATAESSYGKGKSKSEDLSESTSTDGNPPTTATPNPKKKAPKQKSDTSKGKDDATDGGDKPNKKAPRRKDASPKGDGDTKNGGQSQPKDKPGPQTKDRKGTKKNTTSAKTGGESDSQSEATPKTRRNRTRKPKRKGEVDAGK